MSPSMVPRSARRTRVSHGASWHFNTAGLFNAVLFVTALAGWSCASDKPTGPPAAAEIKIMDTSFVPAIVSIDPGQTVEWINRSRDHRTVTSGLDAADPEAGQDFDVDLAGYRPGEPDGGHFRKTFANTDTVHFFSRIAPSGLGGTIRGTIIIR